MLIQVLVLQRSCKLFGAAETTAESLGCFNPTCTTQAAEREEERSGDAIMAALLNPDSQPSSGRASAFPGRRAHHIP